MEDAKLKVSLIILVLVLAGFFLLSPAASSPSEKMRVGWQPIAPHILTFIAFEKGFFKEEGLDVELVKFGSANQLLDALAAGQIDGAGTSNLGVLFSAEARSPGHFKLFGLTYFTNETAEWSLLAGKNSAIFQLKDLEGKKLGLWPGSFTKTILTLALKKSVDVSKIQFVEVPAELQLQTLDSGQVDALFTLEPYNLLAIEKNIATELWKTPQSTVLEPMPVNGPIVSTRLVAERKETARKFVVAIQRAIDFKRSNPLEAKEILLKYANLDASITAKLSNAPIKKFSELTDQDFSQTQAFADLLASEGVLTKQINVSKMILTPGEIT